MVVARLDFSARKLAAPAQDAPRAGAVLYLLWALFWLLMIVVAIQDGLRNPEIRWWEPVLWEGSSAMAATFWLLMLRRVERDYALHLDRPLRWFGQHLKWLPLLVLTFVPAVYGLRHAVYALLGETYRHASWSFVFTYETIKLALFVGLWLGIIFGFNSFAQWQAQRQRLLGLQKSLAEAQLSQLKAQLRPHFFFNALNTISALMHVDVERADRLLARLGELLRASLQSSSQEMTSLREELRLLELYAQVMQERFADRVSLEWHVDPGTANAVVPGLLLQPLLENAFKHGVERSREPVRIGIQGGQRDGQLYLAIRNTGSNLAPDHREGVGLRNCRERLKLLYGDMASLELTQQGDAVEASIVLPWREHSA